MSRAPILYQETRISLTPASPSQVLTINTTPNQQAFSVGAGRKRGFDEISSLDEESYARKHLATESSVFFRRKDRTPRSFLWRVLEDRKVLEIKCVDLLHDSRNARSDSWLSFRIRLPGEIVKDGVALADREDTDALEVFVLAARSELYTFTLKRDLLTREVAPSEFDDTTCFRKYSSSSLPFNLPYRLVAVSSLELLISLQNGGLMRLERQPNENAAQWRETFFSEVKWGDTIRGLVSLKRRQTVRYGDLELDPTAAAAMAKSPDGKYIWTVSLDHELRAWSVKTGKAVAQTDILDERMLDEPRKQQKYTMAAEQGTLLQVVMLPTAPNDSRSLTRKGEGGEYFLVLHSPKDHQFKFYQVNSLSTSADGQAMGLEDLQRAAKLIPPIDELMNTNVWHLENFHVLPGVNWLNSQIWIRARSGTLCRIFTMTFSLLDEDGQATDAELIWQTGWTVVDPGMQTTESLRMYTDFPGDIENVADGGSTPSEMWLDFLFHPSRFSNNAIETALHVYSKGRGLSASSSRKGLNASEQPLKERLTQAIASKIMLRRLPNEQPDYEKYQSDIQEQWKTFYALLSHLHTRRHDSIGLAIDAEHALAWSISADFVAPIRASNHFEMLALNTHLLHDEIMPQVDEVVVNKIFPEERASLLSEVMAIAGQFSGRLSAEFREKFRNSVLVEAICHEFNEFDRNRERVQALYETHRFNAEVMDDDFQALENSAENLGGLGILGDQDIIDILDMLQEEAEPNGTSTNRSLKLYGAKFTVAVAQDTLERDRGVLLDLLMLVVFMYGDLDQADLHADFVEQIGPLYDAIIARLKHNTMLSWLASNIVAEPQKQHRSSKSSQTLENDTTTVTLLERIFIGDWEARSTGNETFPRLLTIWSKQWAYGPNLYEEWDGVTGHIMAFLIKEQSYELATEFRKFLSQGEDSSSWLRYLEARLLVATGDYAEASLKFRAAADGMAEARRVAGVDTAHLLAPEERNYFGEGLSSYYQHASALFEKLRIFSYTADFANLALQNLGNDGDLGSSLAEIDRRKMMDSPEISRIDDSLQEIGLLKAYQKQDEIRNRLCNALVQTGRSDQAFEALAGISDLPMKRANLSGLAKACVEKDAVRDLLELPFSENDLVQEADQILLGLAKRGLESGSGTTHTPYYQILYAFRTQRSDFRGAAKILYEYLDRLRFTQNKHGMLNPEEETLIQAYVLLLNTLACCGDENGWLLADPIEEVNGVRGKRKLVTIADVRREYGAELDKRSDLLHGRFPLVGGGEEMDVL